MPTRHDEATIGSDAGVLTTGAGRAMNWQWPARCANRLRRRYGRSRGWSALEAWEHRARQYGRRAVLNLGHPAEDFERVTAAQATTLMPLLQSQLRGDERTALDFGCGPGRFSTELARLVHGRCVAVDPVQRFLDLAPPSDNVDYQLAVNGRVPLDDGVVDVAWVCLVLGGILDSDSLESEARELVRVLKPAGLLFLVENTADLPPAPHWVFRSPDDYLRLFPEVALQVIGGYEDLGEQITVMAGRKRVQSRTIA